jgi:peptide/nickel transport system substrate-binding protein
MKRSRWLVLASAGVAMLFSTCDRSSSARPTTTLTAAVQADITGLYPDLRNESYTYSINTGLYEGLTRFGRNLEPEPAVADRWESPDERTWLFHIRPGLRFSNGDPVRGADVVASIRFAQELDATRHLMAPVAAVEESEPGVVRIRTKFPFPVLLAHLTCALILPGPALQQHSVPSVGTGPFQLEAWLPGKELDLKENPFFRGPKPDFNRVRLVVTPDRAERMKALLEGRAQIADNVPVNQISELRRHTELRVVTRPSLKVLFLVLRINTLPFSRPLVRRALDLAIDRDELVARALNGFGTPSFELVPPTVLGYNASLQSVKPDRSLARELLRTAGYPNGFRVRLDGPTNRYTNGVEIMTEVARQLGEIGVQVDVNPMPKEQFFALLDAPEPRFLLYGWSCETVQAGEALDELVRTTRLPGLANVAAFSDPKLDALIDAADQSPSLRRRAELLAMALERVGEIRAFLPLVIQNESFAFSRAIDWDPSLDMALRVHEMKLRRAVQNGP